MRKITITWETYGEKPRTLAVMQVNKDMAVVIENNKLACPCCVSNDVTPLLEIAAKELGLSCFLWHKSLSNEYWIGRCVLGRGLPGHKNQSVWSDAQKHRYVLMDEHLSVTGDENLEKELRDL